MITRSLEHTAEDSPVIQYTFSSKLEVIHPHQGVYLIKEEDAWLAGSGLSEEVSDILLAFPNIPDMCIRHMAELS